MKQLAHNKEVTNDERVMAQSHDSTESACRQP
jgi:hypothetical protein